MHLKTSDGRGGTYDDTLVHSTSAGQVKLAIYGAERSSDGALTLMIVNKRGENLTRNPNLSGFNPRGSAQVYHYSAVNLRPVAREANQATHFGNGFAASYPTNSTTLAVVPKVGSF